MTATVFARLHGRLTQGAVGRLVRLNLLRTVGWTASAGVALALVLSAEPGSREMGGRHAEQPERHERDRVPAPSSAPSVSSA